MTNRLFSDTNYVTQMWNLRPVMPKLILSILGYKSGNARENALLERAESLALVSEETGA